MMFAKILLSILFVMFVIQAEQSLGECFDDIGFRQFDRLGLPLNDTELRMLLAGALKIDDCARVISIKEPIPLRFRRGLSGKKFQCVISLN
jgi:hypothetical protein